MNRKRDESIMVVDDDEGVLATITLPLIEEGYSVRSCRNAREAIDNLHGAEVDVILTDIRMPGMSGIELLENIHEMDPELPVILMTAYAELDLAVDAIKKGAFDFILKPFDFEQIGHSIRKALTFNRFRSLEKNYRHMLEESIRQKTRELSDALVMIRNVNKEIINRLTTAAEFRDEDTGAHILRIGLYSHKIAEAMDMPKDFMDTISLACQMHDIGKIGIPDSILLKPGKLTPEEFEIIKSHTWIGERILSGSRYPIMQMAASIALNHHERYDGTGYPRGLSGNEIPIEGRIALVADQYDALRSKRPYKPALSHEEAFTIITEGDGRTLPGHFDPGVLGAFVEAAPVLNSVFTVHQGLSGSESRTRR